MKKENLKPNEVGAPTIFIGVGGIGSDIVRKVAERCQQKETENISFICMDTNVNDLRSVQKSKANIYYVQTSSTQTVGDYLDYDEDARKNWFPKNAVMYDKTVSEGAGQVRAISRLALNATIKTGQIRPLYEAIDDLFRKNGEDLQQALRVVFASTASGGTGSGIILPLSMFVRDYVREKYPNTAVNARALILLPETLDSVISSTQEKESQRRNAYATIKEINAFMMKGSRFFELDEDLKRYDPLCVNVTLPDGNNKSLAYLPLDFCFLLDGQDTEDKTMISLPQYEEQAAQALYEQNIGPMQKKAFSLEDNIIKELAERKSIGRSRFGGIGSSILRYPYEEVADYVAYCWALDNIGGEDGTGKWGKYDKEFELKQAEARKKGLPASDAPTLGEVYIRTLKTSKDPFSKDICAKYLQGDRKRINVFFSALQEHMHASMKETDPIKERRKAANALAEEIDYSDLGEHGKAPENLQFLREYEKAVKINTQKMAESAAEAIFANEKQKTINEKQPYTIEALLKNSYGEIAHPVAARVLLYMARDEFEKRIKTTNVRLDEVQEEITGYSSQTTDLSTFDRKSTRKKKEVNLDQVCEAEKDPAKYQGLIQRITERFGKSDIYPFLNECFTDYHALITEFMELTADLEAYKQGLDFIRDACEMYERFFASFPEKVSALVHKREDLVSALAFVPGDSVLNVCSDEVVLRELAHDTSVERSDGAMLDNELNGNIYDAIKKNVAFEREIRYLDIVEEDKRIDIFDQIVLGYFQMSVRDNCEKLDVNIVQAMALENRLQARALLREKQGEDVQLVDHVTHEENERYIKKLLGVCERLAAPGIQRLRNEEPREVKCVAYNSSLNDMPEYRMSEMFGEGVSAEGCDNISKYEMHFFMAIYNLTPDKLNKFACPVLTEVRDKNSGLYFNAYMSYAKYLGPDSTKNMMISTHIDKRWDSIAFMPELDFNFMKQQMMKMHKALIYALLYGAIKQSNLSAAAGGKKIFRYENSDERIIDLTVSNGTLCDEFYEIVDSLYIDASVVEDIGKMCEENHVADLVRSANYDKTFFAKSVLEFVLPSVHEGVASLFEIPLAYYNSLPNSRRFTSEIYELVEAVIETFEDELSISENTDDVKFMLCDILKEQFELLMKNYYEYEILNMGKPAQDNVVIDTVFRKIRHVFTESPEPDDYDTMLKDMKALIV